MNRFHLLLFFLFLTSCSTIALFSKNEIPEKREFPIDRTINPCHNFYQYACNGVISNFELRDDRSRHAFAFTDQSDRLLKIKMEYFKNLKERKSQTPIEEEIKRYYTSCTDRKSLKAEELEEISSTLKTMASLKSREEFLRFVALSPEKDHLTFLTFSTSSNLDRPQFMDLFFWSPLRSIPEKSYLENKDLMKEHYQIMVDFFKLLNMPDEESRQRASAVSQFEISFLKIYPTPAEINKIYDERTEISRKELIQKYPNLYLKDFLHKNIPPKVLIRNVIGNQTFQFLNDQLGKLSVDDLKSLYLYFSLKGIIDESYPDFFQKQFSFHQKFLGGAKKRAVLEERCSNETLSYFNMEVDFILMPQIYPHFPRERFMNMVERVRYALIDSLKKNSWLTPSAKKEALRKIEKTDFKMVSPTTESDWNFNLRRDYFSDRFLKNRKIFNVMYREKTLSELGRPINIKRWEMGPLTVNAYFNPNVNQIVFPIAILQPPFYDSNVPDEVNLGAIGMVIGHELGHSIDDQGSTFDANGIKREWMSAKDLKNFKKLSKPLIEQFNKIGHNGEFTLGENIGDFVGLHNSYKAAFIMSKEKSADQIKKDFFLSYARIWCEVERPDLTKLRLKMDPHSLGEARVNEQVKQMKEFQELFQCQENDPMTISSQNRIKIW